MTSSGRELLKWVALVFMTGDHVAKVLFGGYVPVASELGRIAFPVFALVMAYNLAQPNADAGKSLRRLLLWGVIAQPAHAFALGNALPLNVLLSFALAAACIWSVHRRRWWLLVLLAGPAPLLVDYQWSGIALVVAWWWAYRITAPLHQGYRTVGYHDALRRLSLAVVAFVPLCFYNGNAWALLALPFVVFWQGSRYQLPRTRWAFYGYYVGHLVLLAGLLYLHPSVVHAPESLSADASFTGL